ncbi:MAG: T9SS type A sorting domain-containing protein [Candidatus Poribacteria bacterium]|nr:T9SS type A sorting domain-containing protein [Candidatus Poribacteria bacterium]
MRIKLFLFFLTVFIFSIVYSLSSFAQDSPQWHLPEGAITRFGKGKINEIQYSSDSTQLAVASRMGIWIYDAHSGKELRLITGHTSFVLSISYSPDGQTLASGSADNTVRLWNPNTGQHKKTLKGHTGWVRSVAFSPDGQTLASGSYDTTVRLWDAETGNHTHTLSGHTDWVSSVSFSPDSTTLATGSRDTTIRLWNAAMGTHIATFTRHRHWVESVVFNPDGQTLASTDVDNNVSLLDAETGTRKDFFSTGFLPLGNTNFINSIAFSPDGTILVGGSTGGELRVWNVHRSGYSTIATAGAVESVAFSPDGQTLAYATYNEIHLWNTSINIGDVLIIDRFTHRETLTGHTGEATSVAFSPNGQALAIGDYRGGFRLWYDLSGEPKLTGRRYMGRVWSIVFSSDGTTIATGGRSIFLWDALPVEKRWEQPQLTMVYSVAFSPDGNTIATGTGVIDRWGEYRRADIELWDAVTGENRWKVERTYAVYSVAFSPDGTIIATGSGDNTLRLWNANTGEHIHTFTGHTAAVLSVAFSPDGTIIATGSSDNTLRLWNANTGEHIDTFTEHIGNVYSVAFSPDGTIIATGSGDNTLRLWNVNTREHIHTFTGHTGNLLSVAFSPDGTIIATGSNDGTALLWDASSFTTSIAKDTKADVNGDGIVNIQDLVLVAGKLGQTGTSSADVNGDGVVNIQDLVLVAGALGNGAAAPSLHPQVLEMLTATEVKQWLSEIQQLGITDITSQRGILFLQQLLIALTPKETALLPNYPNPFNPETWIPYHLSKDADVTLHIYAVNGTLVRTLTLGHQAAGMYQNRSGAAYWDGKNQFGEKVASGLYFYTLTADDFTATRKMLIRK